MSTQNPNEVWQVEVGGQVYEAPFVELGDWIGEGSLLPQDKVRKGNLRWIEARHVPLLVPFFNAKEKGLPMPVMFSTTEAEAAVPAVPVEHSVSADNFQPSAVHIPEPIEHSLSVLPANPSPIYNAEPVEHSLAVPPTPKPAIQFGEPVEHSLAAPQAAIQDPNFCALHAGVPSVFLCGGCGNGFCKVCPKAYGGSVRICPFCGAMCKSTNEVVQQRTQAERRATAIDKGFGAEDFFNALAHPFKFKSSLFFGVFMFAGFSLGQSVTGLGGIYMMVSAIFCVMLGNTLSFGVMSNTIDNFVHGHLEANFMPAFDDFELWDDVIHPFFLSIAAYAAAFGPFFIVLIIGYNMVLSNVDSQREAFQQSVEKIPGTHYYDA